MSRKIKPGRNRRERDFNKQNLKGVLSEKVPGRGACKGKRSKKLYDKI